MVDHKQSFLTTILALLTAVGALVGAIGGLIATIYATGGDGAASTPSPVPAISTVTPAATRAPSPTPTVNRSTPTTVTIEIGPEADSWWGSPGWSSSDDEEGHRGEDEELRLEWGCSSDSRGNGSRRDCGTGMIAVRFDLGALPDDATIEEAYLGLFANDGGQAKVYARRGISVWREDDSAEPECDSNEKTPADISESEWTWDVTTIMQGAHSSEETDLSFCLVLEDSGAVTFESREGSEARAPVLVVKYR